MHPLPSLSVVALTFTILPLMAAAQSFSYGPRNTDFPPAFPEASGSICVNTQEMFLACEIKPIPVWDFVNAEFVQTHVCI